jgi:hypothetical protein
MKSNFLSLTELRLLSARKQVWADGRAVQDLRRMVSSAQRRANTWSRSDGTAGRPASSYDLLLRADALTRATYLATLQRSVGNRQVVQLLDALAILKRTPPSAPGVAAGHGGGGGFHGRTEGEFDRGKKKLQDVKVSRATGCNCPADQPCMNATATMLVTYKVKVKINMPSIPGGLSTCKRQRVAAFFKNELRPHEEEHKRRFESYNGTTRRAISAKGCGRGAAKSALEDEADRLHGEEAADRESAAKQKSAAIDPFFRVVDYEGCK